MLTGFVKARQKHNRSQVPFAWTLFDGEAFVAGEIGQVPAPGIPGATFVALRRMLTSMKAQGLRGARIVLDVEVVVRQLRGQCDVNAPALKTSTLR